MHSKPCFIKLHPSPQAKSFNKINWIKSLEDFESLGPYMERFLSPENWVWIQRTVWICAQQRCESAPQQAAFSRLLTSRSFCVAQQWPYLGWGEEMGVELLEESKSVQTSKPPRKLSASADAKKLFCYFYFLKNWCVIWTEGSPEFRSEILAALG